MGLRILQAGTTLKVVVSRYHRIILYFTQAKKNVLYDREVVGLVQN